MKKLRNAGGVESWFTDDEAAYYFTDDYLRSHETDRFTVVASLDHFTDSPEAELHPEQAPVVADAPAEEVAPKQEKAPAPKAGKKA